MANTYSRDILKVVVAQICQTIGWHTICTTPLDVLTDVLRRFIHALGTSAHRYGEQFGHTSPNVIDVTLAFKDLGINISELEEYVEYVASVPCAVSVPKYPVERESHLNMLKPGSREVVTRPVHIHEHLPAMHPQLEEEEYLKQLPLSVDISGSEPGTSPLSSPKNSIFKRPGDPVSIDNKRARMMLEEEGRPLREISSVMMTTSGFLSPAREGKLPEARTPTQSSDSRSSSPQPLSYPTVPPEVKGEKKVKKYNNKPAAEGIRKLAEKELLKHTDFTSVAQAADDDDLNVKKLVSMKEMYKLKALKPGALKMHSPNNGVSGGSGTKNKSNKHKNAGGISAAISSLPKIPKLSQSKNSKNDKSSSGNQSNKSATNEKTKEVGVIDGKLSSEPDKQKLNIFKKISKVKEDKVEPSDATKSAHEAQVSVSMELENKQRDVRWAQISETIEAVIQKSREQPAPSPERHPVVEVESSDSELFPYDDDLSPPGTPSTPRTPDLIPPQKKSDKHLDSKKKKKGKRDKDKRDSSYGRSPSPKRFKSESTESDYSLLEKPKTPEVESSRDEPTVLLPRNREDVMTNHIFPFFPYAPQPGLIPTPINPSLFNRFNMPLGKQPGLIPHPAMPNLPLAPPLLSHANKHEDNPPVKSKKQSSLSPVPATTQNTHSSPSSRASPSSRLSPSSHVSPSSRAVSPVTVSTITASETTDSPSSVAAPPKEKSSEKKKEHKKEKKEKIKKKKDKKDKLKSKEKGEKKKIKSGKKIKDKEKNKEKKEKKEKKKDKEREEKEKVVETAAAVPKLTLKLGPASPQTSCPAPASTDTGTTHRKIVIKPVVEPKAEEKRSPSPELARISALVTRPSPANSKPPPPASLAQSVHPVAEPSHTLPHPAPKKPTIKTKEVPKKVNQGEPEKKEPVAFYFDNDGNQVWICPACGGQDDGSPMIGCDGCDAWYHWVCVGIQVPPDSNDWFCRVCIAKRQDGLVSEKKKKTERRKKKAGAT